MIQMYHVSKVYPGGIPALQDISLRVEKGEFVFLTGPSGAGKTTLIKLLLGIEKATSGQIIVGGKNLFNIGSRDLARLRSNIGVVFQDFRLLKDRTVEENVGLSLQMMGLGRKEISRRVNLQLKKMGLAHRLKVPVVSLSGGEQQRIAIARATINNPLILLADEPTGNLDPDLSWEILGLFREINARGTTILVATHDPRLYANHLGKVFYLENGRLVRGE